MIITDFNKWSGYQFGNKLLGVNNLIQISNFYKQDYYFTTFNGLGIFDIKTATKNYNNSTFEVINPLLDSSEKYDIILDNDKIYYLDPCLFELYHEFNTLSTFDIFKIKDPFNFDKKTVGIHFRGTDFEIWDEKCILPFEYYKNSIDFVISDITEDFNFILYTDDQKLESFKKSIEYLKSMGKPYILGNINSFIHDFRSLSHCDYIISTPSTFCITASFCGKKDKKIIHSYDFIWNYKYKSTYFRDIFWKKIIDFPNNNDYNIYKLI